MTVALATVIIGTMGTNQVIHDGLLVELQESFPEFNWWQGNRGIALWSIISSCGMLKVDYNILTKEIALKRAVLMPEMVPGVSQYFSPVYETLCEDNYINPDSLDNIWRLLALPNICKIGGSIEEAGIDN